MPCKITFTDKKRQEINNIKKGNLRLYKNLENIKNYERKMNDKDLLKKANEPNPGLITVGGRTMIDCHQPKESAAMIFKSLHGGHYYQKRNKILLNNENKRFEKFLLKANSHYETNKIVKEYNDNEL